RPCTALAKSRIRADFAVPGGPYRNKCSPATIASAINSTTSSRPTKRCFIGSMTSILRRATVKSDMSNSEQFHVLSAATLRRPIPARELCKALRVEQLQSRMAREAERRRRLVGNVRSHARERPGAQSRSERLREQVVLRQGPRPAMQLG